MSQDINAKVDEIAKALAQKTGVNEKDVAKILEHLGLSSSLQHRQAQILAGVGLDDLRISSGQVTR